MFEPLFVYLPIYHWPDGSCYKYYSLLKQHYGGVLLNSTRTVANPADFKEDIARLKPSLVFCHGDWMHYYVIPLHYGIPYILFEHDIHSLRTELTQSQLAAEREMLEKAAGVIFTSEDHRDYCLRAYPNMCQNIGLVHLKPLKRDLAFSPLPKLQGKHLVYAGGIIDGTGGNYGYRGYKGIFKAFIDAGWTVHAYCNYTQKETLKKYVKDIGIVGHGWIPYGDMLRELSQYTAGLQTYNKEGTNPRAFAYTQTCRPNKTWDYLAAGIPTIGLYPGNCAKIYQAGGWGIVINDTDPATLAEIELPEITPELRFEQNMDVDIPEFDRVIKKALNPPKLHNKKVLTEIKERNEDDMRKDVWYIVQKSIFERGRLLYGRGRRITKSEAIRLGLLQDTKQADLKDKLKEKQAEKVEIKPLDTAAVVTPTLTNVVITKDKVSKGELTKYIPLPKKHRGRPKKERK